MCDLLMVNQRSLRDEGKPSIYASINTEQSAFYFEIANFRLKLCENNFIICDNSTMCKKICQDVGRIKPAYLTQFS